jgi:hypothetical protein
VLVPNYKLFLCHTPIKPDLLGFSGISVFVCGLRDHVIMRFTSAQVVKTLHKSVQQHIENRNRVYATKANKRRKHVVFQPDD